MTPSKDKRIHVTDKHHVDIEQPDVTNDLMSPHEGPQGKLKNFGLMKARHRHHD